MEHMLDDASACTEMFKSFDADGDGFLTRKELSTALGMEIVFLLQLHDFGL